MNYYITNYKLRAVVGDGCHASSLGDLVKGNEKPILMAKCTSEHCLSKAKKKSGGVIKHVSKHNILCPDCYSALVWKIINKGDN